MRSNITTTLTTSIDLETFSPEHAVDIEAEDELPTDVIYAAVIGACKATLNSIQKKAPHLFRDEPAERVQGEAGEVAE